MTSIINYFTELYYKHQKLRDECKNCHTYRCDDDYCGCSIDERKLRTKLHNIITRLLNEKNNDEFITLVRKYNIINNQLEKFEKIKFHDL